MSEIHDPAQPDAPPAPGDQGPTNEPTPAQRPEPGNERPAHAAHTAANEPDEPSPGNERPAEAAASGNEAPDEAPELAYDEAPEDSIGNRMDAPPTHMGTASGVDIAGGGQAGRNKRRRDRKRGKGGGQPGAAPGAEGQPAGNDRPANAGNRPHGGGGGEAQHRAFHVGDKVRARIVTIGAAGAFVDLWGKEQGVLDLSELTGAEGVPEPKAGDGVDVVVIQDGVRGGNLVVTRDPTRAERGREQVVQAFNANDTIEGLITGVNRGGLEVDLSGVRAFCPSSQIDVRFPPTVSPKQLVLTRQAFKVTSLVDDGKEAIVSRRAIVEGEVRARAEQARENIKVGDTVKGRVVSVKDYGVFVDLDGIEGMIHVSELSWNRSARPQDLVKPGDEIEAKVLKISSGQRPTQPPPANEADAATTPPATSEPVEEAASDEPATEATEAVEGEATSESTATSTTQGSGPAKKGARNKRKEVRRAPRGPLEGMPRVVLSRRAIEPDPWAGIEKRFAIGSVHAGKVARMQPFGAFIELEPGVDGLLHVSELGEGRRIEHPNEVLKDGQAVNVRVERVDRGAKRISLSRLPEGVTEDQLKKAIVPRVGLITKGTVAEHESGGFYVQIDGAIGKLGRGFVVDRESNQPRGTDLRRAIPTGTSVNVKIVEIDRGRPKLSIRAALQDEERSAYRAYQKEANSTRVGVSLADKLRGALGKK